MQVIDQILTCYCHRPECEWRGRIETLEDMPAVCPECGHDKLGCSVFTSINPGPQYQPRPHIVISGNND